MATLGSSWAFCSGNIQFLSSPDNVFVMSTNNLLSGATLCKNLFHFYWLGYCFSFRLPGMVQRYFTFTTSVCSLTNPDRFPQGTYIRPTFYCGWRSGYTPWWRMGIHQSETEFAASEADKITKMVVSDEEEYYVFARQSCLMSTLDSGPFSFLD